MDMQWTMSKQSAVHLSGSAADNTVMPLSSVRFRPTRAQEQNLPNNEGKNYTGAPYISFIKGLTADRIPGPDPTDV